MAEYFETFESRGHLYNNAMSNCPHARDAELQALLDRVNLVSGQTVMDAPAGGGYVSDAVYKQLDGQVTILCVEPSPKFSAAIQGPYRIFNNSVDKVNLTDESVDVVLSLAGLHHVKDRTPIYNEWARLLKPGGQLAVADVSEDTGTGEFLNTFVDTYAEGGHDGMFITPEEFTTGLHQAGLVVDSEELLDVSWGFPSEEVLGDFCRTLFGTHGASRDMVIKALSDTVGIESNGNGGVDLKWQLRYASALKPVIH